MILDRLADATRARYAQRMADTPLDIVKSRALALPKGNFAFERALEAPGVSLICEVKKASPSKGLISPDFPYLDIARDYAAAGAAAISCLTEPDYFLGDDRYLQEIAAAVPIPVLRKDFTLYDYQIYEAKVLGAGAVLLICALLDTDTLRRYIEICDTLGLSALVEARLSVGKSQTAAATFSGSSKSWARVARSTMPNTTAHTTRIRQPSASPCCMVSCFLRKVPRLHSQYFGAQVL